MQCLSRCIASEGQRICPTTTDIGVISARHIEQIVTRSTRNAVTARAACDRVAVA